MRIALGQLNSTVGDLIGNAQRMIEAARAATARGAEVIVFPELSLAGYPPRDLVEKESFLSRTAEQLARLAAGTANLSTAIACGYVGKAEGNSAKQATNSAALIESGRIVFLWHKILPATCA